MSPKVAAFVFCSPNMNASGSFRRTRIAPTPSGYLHPGNILSFVVTAGLARRHGAEILLRIDDLDQPRVRREYVEDIFETLRFLSIPWDLGPRDTDDLLRGHSQLKRMDVYRDALAYLKEQDAVFACACSRSQLAAISPGEGYPGTCQHLRLSLDVSGYAWRLKTPSDKMIRMQDLRDGVQTFTLPASMKCVQVRRKDGYPAYQLASVMDDIRFGVDLVVRGADLHDSTLAQLCLSAMLPDNHFADTVFLHHQLLTGLSGEKLSKSAGAGSVGLLRRQGHDARDIFSMIAGSVGSTERPDNWEALFELLAAEGGMLSTL